MFGISKTPYRLGSKILVSMTETKMHKSTFHLDFVKLGSGKHVVTLLPGALGTYTTDFSPQLERLNRTEFTIIAINQKGYGRTHTETEERSFPPDFYYRDADDVVTLMQELNIPKYSLLGWSDGGNVAAIIAARYPDSVSKLVMWGSNSYVTPEEYESYKAVRDISLWSDKMKQPMIKAHGKDYFEKTWHAWVDSFDKMERNNNSVIDIYMNELKNISAETLIIHGMKDRLVPLFQTEHLHKNIENSKLVVWDDGSHNLHLRYPDRFVSLVESFLLAKKKL